MALCFSETNYDKKCGFILEGWSGRRCCELCRNYGMVVILLSILCNYDDLPVKLHQEKCRYLDEGWIFISKFKVRNLSGMSVFLVASKNKGMEIHEYNARSLIKSYNNCKW